MNKPVRSPPIPAALSPDLLEKWMRIGAPRNYLTVGQIFLQDNDAVRAFVFRFGEPGDTEKLGTRPGRATGRCVIPPVVLWSGVQNGGPLPSIPPTGLAAVHASA
jgi:hypothetical protein